MTNTVIIAEFNPLHNGHKLLIDKAKQDGENVIIILSDNFLQRGEPALYSKNDRADMAIKCGADLVVELPCPYSMSFAQNYAYGAVSLIKSLNICDKLLFGSECGNVETLNSVSEILNGEKFKSEFKKESEQNKTFAKTREEIFQSIAPEFKGILDKPNNALAIEYINAIKKHNLNITVETVKRKGAMHDGKSVGNYASASEIRKLIKENKISETKKYLPEIVYNNLSNYNKSDSERLNIAVLSYLRGLKKDVFENLPDISEGLENRVYSAVKTSTTYDGLLNEIKSKRYTLARIRRICLSAYLDIDSTFTFTFVPYIRILGLGKNGSALLKIISENSSKPIITKAKDFSLLTGFAEKTFQIVSRSTDLYSLSLDNPLPCGNELTAKMIKE